jgi:serine protease AprX
VDAVDHLGHGTHVAGIIAGNGYDSNGQYIGIAPNSLLVSVKVSDDQGDMNEGDVITGLDWVYQANQHGMHIRIINMSLSSTAQQSYNSSALDAMVEKLWNSGVVVVTSAGTGSGTVSSAPGNDPYAITVGSIDDQYQTDPSKAVMASWSPYGYTPDGFAKPELVADGSHVVSLLAPGSTMSAQHPTNVVGTSYFMMGGTSMAAPQVAGMAALMLQAIPSLTNNQVKGVLMKHHANFSSIAYTSWLGNQGGLLNQGAVGHNDATSNQGLTWSQAYDSQHQAILAFGIWWTDVTWASASWNSSSWPSSWNSGSWNSGSWNGTAYSSGSWNSGSWNSGSWNSGSWNSGSWNSGSWNSGSWNSASWNSGSWNGAIYS